MRALLVGVAMALLAACSESAPDRDPAPTPNAPVSTGISAASPSQAAPSTEAAGDSYRYTSLSDCRLIRSAPEEAGFAERDCPGEGGYRLRLVSADLRDDLALVGPRGKVTELGLQALAGGGFSTVGSKAEWRGDATGDAFQPAALILRHTVAESPDPNVPEVSYLVVTKLGPKPCVIARIRPGASQNEQARTAADKGGACLRPPA